MLHFLYNIMVYENVRGGNGPPAAHRAFSNSSNCFIQPCSIMAVSSPFRKHLGHYSEFFITVLCLIYNLSLSFLHFLVHAHYYYIFVYPLHYTLPQKKLHANYQPPETRITRTWWEAQTCWFRAVSTYKIDKLNCKKKKICNFKW